jgi:hypothetical protein
MVTVTGTNVRGVDQRSDTKLARSADQHVYPVQAAQSGAKQHSTPDQRARLFRIHEAVDTDTGGVATTVQTSPSGRRAARADATAAWPQGRRSRSETAVAPCASGAEFWVLVRAPMWPVAGRDRAASCLGRARRGRLLTARHGVLSKRSCGEPAA